MINLSFATYLQKKLSIFITELNSPNQISGYKVTNHFLPNLQKKISILSKNQKVSPYTSVFGIKTTDNL